VEIRPIRKAEVDAAGALLAQACARAAAAANQPAPWREEQAIALLGRYAAAEPEGTLVADAGGALAGIGCVRVRGEVATLGPLAVAADGRGTGAALLDALIERAEAAGCHSTRLYLQGWNARGFALCTGRQFSPVDVVARIERAPGPPPRLDASRGLEVGPLRPADGDELVRLDGKLTGHDRRADLVATTRLVARRRGAVVGYLGAAGAALGPAVATDIGDLFVLVGRALAELPAGAAAPAHARLSTAAPAATLAALALGFRIGELGVVMSRGASPPTRPPQLYGIEPEIV
jgi:GNAT superfamily N-acetyltransferase